MTAKGGPVDLTGSPSSSLSVKLSYGRRTFTGKERRLLCRFELTRLFPLLIVNLISSNEIYYFYIGVLVFLFSRHLSILDIQWIYKSVINYQAIVIFKSKENLRVRTIGTITPIVIPWHRWKRKDGNNFVFPQIIDYWRKEKICLRPLWKIPFFSPLSFL